MTLLDSLINKYGYDKPIFLNGISFKNMSGAAIRQQMSRMVKSGKIKKYSQGIYYFPTKTIIGDSRLSSDLVIIDKYISDGGNVIGYPTGLAFMNKLGITYQVPMTYEIVTNAESSRKRTVSLKGVNVILRKPRCRITNDNWKLMQYLDLINVLSEEEIEKYLKILGKCINGNRFRLDELTLMLGYYPGNVSKKIIRSSLINEFIK